MIRITGRNKAEREVTGASTIKQIREELKLENEQYLSLLNGNPATDDEVVNPDDDLLFLEVFSGG